MNEGLEEYYDIVIAGTGLIESIISGAASKRGKKVLHLEKNDSYGDSFAAYNLSGYLEEFSKFSSKKKDCPKHYVIQESDVSANFEAVFDAIKRNRNHPFSNLDNINDFLSSKEGISPDEIHPAFQNLNSKEKFLFAHLLSKDRDINIDMTPKIMFSTGLFIDTLINSGVSKYLEFKALDAVYFYLSREHQSSSASSVLWKTPCTKNDIFNSKQLSALEKRCLMKFHQYVADWGRTHAGEDVKSLNENQLAMGRSLYRPQNKSIASSSDQLDGQQIDSWQSFDELLEHFHLSKKLQALIRYGLCLHSVNGAKSVAQSLTDLALHFNSLARYGETAFLLPSYGLSELVQGYCRLSAVWGGTFILRRGLQTVTAATELNTTTATEVDRSEENPIRAVQEENEEGEKDGEEVCKTEAVVAVDQGNLMVLDSAGNSIRCGQVIMNYAYRAESVCASVMSLQSFLLLQGKIFAHDRSIGILPSQYVYADAKSNNSNKAAIELGNPYAIHLIQYDHTTSSVPEGFTLLHIHTLVTDRLLQTSEQPDENNNTFATWQMRAEHIAWECAQLIQGITQIVLQEADASDETTIVYQHSMVRPVYQKAWDCDAVHGSKVIYTSDWQTSAMHLEDDVTAARDIYTLLFGDQALFDEEAVDTNMEDDFDAEAHEYEAVYKLATSLATTTVESLPTDNNDDTVDVKDTK